MSALEYAKAKLFGPLGINDLYWQQDPQGISNGGYGLYLQPRDMAKIGYLYLRDGVWEGQELLPPAWIDKVSHATIDMHLPFEAGLRYSNQGHQSGDGSPGRLSRHGHSRFSWCKNLKDTHILHHSFAPCFPRLIDDFA
jgi:CubicO group peptidase (beta-lactamase class C family)